MDVDLRLLRYFVAVAEELHFTRAAERLFISQPALSKQVRLLETQLRLKLLRRSSRHVELTAAGNALLPQARQLLDTWSESLTATRAAAAEEDRTLRVGFITNAAGELTTQILAEFTRRRPEWRISMSQALWADPTCGLRDGSVDVAFVRLPVPAQEPLALRILLSEPRWVALPSAHPLARHEVVPFASLLDEPFIATPPESGTWRDFWLAVSERRGHPVRVSAVAQSSEEWIEAIANGFGVGFTAESTARFYHRPGVVYRPVDEISPSRLALAWRREDRRRIIIEFAAACAAAASPAA
ncbi:LysR family transcriptional regulator [Longispora albida]|uniref:LysR family transcriptional regulator n=1 Tax=Longispora albida TaxID=203523 RepID=UPI000371909E|nr:LysR substrate-binding domain-containing protein [Longispora albida]